MILCGTWKLCNIRTHLVSIIERKHSLLNREICIRFWKYYKNSHLWLRLFMFLSYHLLVSFVRCMGVFKNLSKPCGWMERFPQSQSEKTTRARIFCLFSSSYIQRENVERNNRTTKGKRQQGGTSKTKEKETERALLVWLVGRCNIMWSTYRLCCFYHW